jgi:hypothetical protein
MLRIASVFSIALLSLCGCIAESDRAGSLQPERVSIRSRFQIEAGENFHDSLYPLFPNPFNRAAGDTAITIQFTIGDTSRTLVLIQNPLGEEVVRFEDDTLSPGQYRAGWQPLSSEREPLNSGIYFVTFRTDTYIVSRMFNIQTN